MSKSTKSSRSGTRITHDDLEERGYMRLDLHVPPDLVEPLNAMAAVEGERRGWPAKRCRSAVIFSLIREAAARPKKKSTG